MSARFFASCACIGVSAVIPTLPALAQTEVPYTLPKDCRVSLAVYDSSGKMVRTLRNAEPQKAGQQVIKWDGLDSTGQPVAAGDYSWKLLLSQGMKAEYLLSLGTSVSIDHWTAQHGGPMALEALPGGDVLVGAYTEGSPMLVRLNPKISRTVWVNDVWGGGGTLDLAVLEGVVFSLNEKGLVRKFDQKTGRPLGEFRPDFPGEELGPIAPTSEIQRLPFAGKSGAFRLRGKVEFPSGGELKITAGGSSSTVKLAAKGEADFAIPGKDGPHSHMGQFDAAKVKEIVFEPVVLKGKWSAPSVRMDGVAATLSGGDGILAASYPILNRVAWLDPTGKILASVDVKSPQSPVVLDAQTLLVISGNDLLEVKRKGAPKVLIAGLTAPTRVAVDPKGGKIFVAEAGKSQQIKRFSRDGKLEATFGREGGRKPGKYVSEDFSQVAGLAADGEGGFWLTEALSAPRRTAHFDASGNLLGEWFGGQQFYTWAAPDPEDSNIFWMDSQWGWIMKVEVDWDKRTWKVLSTYAWGGNYSPELVNRGKMASQHHVRKLDLDKDGKTETYLVSALGLQKVDEENGRLRMVATLGKVGTNRSWGWDDVGLAKQPKPWVKAIALLGEDPAKTFKNYQAFAWADANGDYEFQPQEFRLFKTGGGDSGGVVGKEGFDLQTDLSVIKKAGNRYERYPLQGFTPSGSPIWDWAKMEPFPIQVLGVAQELFIAPSGDVYQIVHGAGGDGYTSLETFGMAHGFRWPGNQSAEVSVWKWNAQGDLRWRVGTLATDRRNLPGQLHHPVHFAGLVNGTIGVCDKAVIPVAFWTESGLYAGSLFDRRADDGLPPRVYEWWNAGTDDFHPETGRTLVQYDMILGGSLIKRPNGDVIFIGSGWNNCPAYKVTGWDEFQYQEGKVKIVNPATVGAQVGSGLSAEFFTNGAHQGKPVLSLVNPRIWFEPKRAVKNKKPELEWPAAVTDEFSARWTGWVEPVFSEDYRFHLYRKDGQAKLWIDGRLVAEMTAIADKAKSAPIALKAGQKVAIQLEWSGTRSGELHLSWQSVSQPIEHLPARSLYPLSSEVTVR